MPNVQDLPAVRWKVDNLAKLSSEKRVKLLGNLDKAIAS